MFDPDLFRLDGHVAVVTGAGAGIGRGIARVFSGAGASVVVSDLSLDVSRVGESFSNESGIELGQWP